MNILIRYLFSQYHSVTEAKWLRRLLYMFLLVKCVYWCMDFDILFGENSIVYKNDVQLSFFKSFAFLMFSSGSSFFSAFILTATIALCLAGLLLNKFSRIIAFIIWFFLLNINNAVYPTLTGGDFLLQQFLFFNIFLSANSAFDLEHPSEIDKAAHNFGVSALKIQICVVYFISALYKCMDVDWEDGEAIWKIFLIHDFGLPIMYDHLFQYIGVFREVNYFVLAYQLLFPLLIWNKRIKKTLLVLGILQHLYIAFIMGLPTFGFIMIIAYTIFYFPLSNNHPENSPDQIKA